MKVEQFIEFARYADVSCQRSHVHRDHVFIATEEQLAKMLEMIDAAYSVAVQDAKERIAELEALINSPETANWLKGTELEAAHQVERWGVDHDTGKAPMDWFWLVGYLSGKCLAAHLAGNTEKALHHTISTGAALLNWHKAISGTDTRMQPGHVPSIVRAGDGPTTTCEGGI